MKKTIPGANGTGAARRRAAARKPESGPQPFSADELRRIGAEITEHWSRPPEANRLTLLEVDPWRVHAYWHVAEADLAAARAGLHGGGRNAALVLRFTDLSSRSEGNAPPHERFDIEVREARNNWYVGLWRDAKHYSAELGLRVPGGEFVVLARSNEVATPRGRPAPELEFRQLEVRTPRAAQVPSGTDGAPQADLLLSELFPERRRPEDDYPLFSSEPSGVVLDEPPFPALPAEAGTVYEAAAPGGGEADAAAGVAAAGTRDDFPVIPAEEIDPYRALARAVKAELLAEVGTALPPIAADTIAPGQLEWAPQPLPIPPAAVRDADLEAPWGGGPPESATAGAWPHIPLEGLLAGAIFSLGRGDSPVQASAELLIHGRGAPDSPLLLFGQPVQREADGRFAVRLPLPAGPELAALLGQLHSRHSGKDEG
jgi:hypothetical protein